MTSPSPAAPPTPSAAAPAVPVSFFRNLWLGGNEMSVSCFAQITVVIQNTSVLLNRDSTARFIATRVSHTSLENSVLVPKKSKPSKTIVSRKKKTFLKILIVDSLVVSGGSSPGPRYFVHAKLTRFGQMETPSYSMSGRGRHVANKGEEKAIFLKDSVVQFGRFSLICVHRRAVPDSRTGGLQPREGAPCQQSAPDSVLHHRPPNKIPIC